MATTTNNGWETPDDTDLVKDGALAIRTLGQEIDTSVGEGLLAWQSWAPTLSGGWANGNGVWVARYAQLGKTVFVSGQFTLGSTTTKGASLTVVLPVNFQSTSQHVNASVRLDCAGTAFIGNVTANDANTIQVFAQNAAGTYLARALITATVPATWVTGNGFSFNISYEGV
jgi:hypothetical protein